MGDLPIEVIAIIIGILFFFFFRNKNGYSHEAKMIRTRFICFSVPTQIQFALFERIILAFFIDDTKTNKIKKLFHYLFKKSGYACDFNDEKKIKIRPLDKIHQFYTLE